LEGPLRKSRYTEEQIILALKEHEAGRTTAQICRKLGVSEQTFYRWKAKFGGMDVADAKRLKGLEEENRKLKQLVGELALDNQGLRFLLTKKNSEAPGSTEGCEWPSDPVSDERTAGLPGDWNAAVQLSVSVPT
jgi:putative transposase